MKTSKRLSITVAAAVTAGGLTFYNAQAAQGAAGAGGPRAQIRAKAGAKMNLSTEQRAQIKAILKDERGALIGMLRRLKDARISLRETIRASDATEASVRAAAARVAGVQADLAVERLKLYGRISPILTAEQRENLNALQGRLDAYMDKIIDRAGERLAD